MIKRASRDRVVRSFEHRVRIRGGGQFLQLERIVYEDDSQAFQRVEVLTNSGRPRQRQFTSSPVQSHRRQQPRKAVEMVPVQMRNEYRYEPVGAQACPRDLSLRSFSTIKQQPLGFACYCQRAYVALDGRLSRTRAQRNYFHRPYNIIVFEVKAGQSAAASRGSRVRPDARAKHFERQQRAIDSRGLNAALEGREQQIIRD